MFTNPNTIWIEVLVIVLVIGFIAFLIARYIYKKTHNIPTGDCACCHITKKKLLKEYKKLNSNIK